jgi:hypothetical protein
VSNEFGFVVVAASTVSLHYAIYGIRCGSTRYSTFKVCEDSEEAKAMIQGSKRLKSFPKGAHPDAGNGRFSQLLSFDEWYSFNCLQRAHANYGETITPTITCCILSGLFFPRLSSGCAAVGILGREMYLAAAKKDFNKRGPGFLLANISLLVMAGAALFGGVKLACIGWPQAITIE